MKNITVTIITILLFLQPYTLLSVVIPWHQQHFDKNNNREYHENCAIIENLQKIHLTFLLDSHRITNCRTSLKSIQKQLDAFKTELIAQEEKALLAIKEKYHISNEIWQKYLADLHRIKTIHQKKLNENNPKITHDPNIPADILTMLTRLLQQNDINPQSIHLKLVPTNQYNPAILAQAHSFIHIPDTPHNYLISYQHVPSAIEIFPRIIHKTYTDKIAYCAHEIQHIIQHHVLTSLLLYVYLDHYYGISPVDFKQTPEHHKLSQIYEAQAEIFAAIKDPKIAECLKKMRQKSYYPDHLYEDHFLHLCSINTLWKVHEWLESFNQNNLKI